MSCTAFLLGEHLEREHSGVSSSFHNDIDPTGSGPHACDLLVSDFPGDPASKYSQLEAGEWGARAPAHKFWEALTGTSSFYHEFQQKKRPCFSIKSQYPRSSLMAQRVKELVLPSPCCRFNPWPANFYVLWLRTKKKKKRIFFFKKGMIFFKASSPQPTLNPQPLTPSFYLFFWSFF